MLFFEPIFLFLFLPILCGLFFALRKNRDRRLAVLLVGSVLFYLWGEPLFVPVLLVSCVVDYLLGKSIAGTAGRRRRLWLTLGVCGNLGILLYYKYTNFFVHDLNDVAGHFAIAPVLVKTVALPIGVSFVVFEKITYLVDIHREKSRTAPSFATYLLYVFFFPKLLAGPIIKYHEIEGQLLAATAWRFDSFEKGFPRFMLGVAKKTLLADTLAAGADATFAVPVSLLGSGDAWWGVLFFTFQIYFDFSAYSDMAIGLARIFGFELNENFDMPYISCSITEFWRRWHISLSTWIREYMYIPLGGNRVSPARRYGNLWLCFLASGLWHGAAWTYVVWGAYNGVFLVLDRLFLLRALGRLPKAASTAFTFLVTIIGWTIFRAATLRQGGAMLWVMLHPSVTGAPNVVDRTSDMKVAVLIAAAICVAPRLPRADRVLASLRDSPGWRTASMAAIAALFVCGVGKAVADPFKPFLYFRF